MRVKPTKFLILPVQIGWHDKYEGRLCGLSLAVSLIWLILGRQRFLLSPLLLIYCLRFSVLKENLYLQLFSESRKSIDGYISLALLRDGITIVTVARMLLVATWWAGCSNWKQFMLLNCSVWLDRFWTFQITFQAYAKWFISNVLYKITPRSLAAHSEPFSIFIQSPRTLDCCFFVIAESIFVVLIKISDRHKNSLFQDSLVKPSLYKRINLCQFIK